VLESRREAFARVDGALYIGTAAQVAELQPDLGAATAHLDVMHLHDPEQVVIQLDGDALLQFAGRYHLVTLRFVVPD